MNEINIDIGIKFESSAEDKAYNDACAKYRKVFGYQPLFIALPDPTIEEILNAVETGVELYEKESTNGDIIL